MSNYELRFSKRAEKDLRKIKESGLYDKFKDLLRVLRDNPYQNPPPFEKLAGGDYSRRINIQHRLVYHVQKEERVIVVTSMWTHYE
jgi:Txe/YoeB family toxin of toxin-antitoxin system